MDELFLTEAVGVKQKNYDNSYLFCKDIKTHHRNLTEFIIKSQRIDKNSEAFIGIKDDIKRMQRSSVLYSILNSDKVVLCIGAEEMPAAFKVFSAKDLRFGDGTKVFIDVTGLISYNNGYFTCRAVDILTTYLFSALTYLLYIDEPIKLHNNSSITISGTECFVSLFDYILDYMRVLGYEQNKDKISYIVGLYFLYNLMGKDIDQYSKSIATKAARITAQQAKLYDIYVDNEEEDFKDIDHLINLLVKNFKIKGITTEVFISKWIYLFKSGTQYATELFTSFATMLVSAYCGTYIVNQKQIERCCGTQMVNFCTSLLKLGTDVYDKRGYLEADQFDNSEFVASRSSALLKEAVFNRNKVPEEAKFKYETFESKDSVSKTAKAMVNYYRSVEYEDKIGDKIADACVMGVRALDKSIYKDGVYASGSLEVILREYKGYKTEASKRKIDSKIRDEIDKLQDSMKKLTKEECKKFVDGITELRKVVALL